MKLRQLITYLGPNRRSDNTLIEMDFEYSPGDMQAISTHWESGLDKIRAELALIGVDENWPQASQLESNTGPVESFCSLCSGLAVVLQNQCGHKINEQSFRTFSDRDRCQVLFEHDEFIVGEQAGTIALTLIEQAFPELSIDLNLYTHDRSIADLYQEMNTAAAKLIPPEDTTAIVNAARRQGVPVLKLERGMYESVQGDFRIRMNSMLMLGHSAQRQVIDGTFALEKSAPAHGMIFDRVKVMNIATRLAMPVPASYRQHQPVISPRRAERAAREIGYPVVVKSTLRRKAGSTRLNVMDEQQIRDAAQHVARFGGDLLVEGYVSGESWNLLVANQELISCTLSDGTEYQGDLHPSTREMVINAQQTLNVGLLAVNVVSQDLSKELGSGGGAVVDLDVAPRLDELLGAGSPLLEKAADNFMRWLMPQGEYSRIPIIAVTGTNGKTTTSRMVNHILKQTGRVTGLQCTDGRYVNDKLILKGDSSALKGHDRLLQDQSVQVAVFETHHAGMASGGFAFDWCDVAICTNVTEEHMGQLCIDTLDEMIELKRSLIERAKFVAILNADSEACVSMLPYVTAKRTCLTSMEKSADDLAGLTGTDRLSCVLEEREGNEWIVIHDAAQAIDLMPVKDIPATFDGRARFNVMNAMQAIAGCYAEGVDPAVIRGAMSTFSMTAEDTPWRLNFVEGLPFQVLTDFAHNPDGMNRVAEFSRNIEVSGQKIVSFSGFRSDRQVRLIAEAVAGSYDHYVLKNYFEPENIEVKEDREKHEITDMMKAVLLDKGVDNDQISIVLDEKEAIRYALDMAVEGDLVVLLLGYVGFGFIDELMADYIANYGSGD